MHVYNVRRFRQSKTSTHTAYTVTKTLHTTATRSLSFDWRIRELTQSLLVFFAYESQTSQLYLVSRITKKVSYQKTLPALN